MKSKDILQKSEIRSKMMQALREDNREAFSQAFEEMLECIGEEIRQEYETRIDTLKTELDAQVLTARGVRQLTTTERDYYQKLTEAMKSRDPKQAVTNLDIVMPETIINSVLDNLEENHPLLSHIDFIPTNGAIKMMMNTHGHQEAVWGELCDEIVKELTSGFKEVDTGLLKLSAFLPVCKAMLDLGPEWLDSYVRRILAEALACGLEKGIVTGDGNKKPIGMNRQVGDGVTVTGGVYPEKAKITVTDLSVVTMGKLIALMAAGPNGKSRAVNGLLLIVNPQDYFEKIMPATTIMAPDGTYRNNVLPYPVTILQSEALDRGAAILGIGKRYFAAAGSSQKGKIEFSDHYRFLEDERVYLIKAYANGMALDNNAFLHLDISGIQPATYQVTQIAPQTLSSNANLSDLKIGSLALSPAFTAATKTYTASTTNATNTITAIPADAGASIEVAVGSKTIENGSAATWEVGANTVTIKVTAADGTTTATYTATVTKS